MFEVRAEGDAQVLEDPQDDLFALQEQQQHGDRGGDQMSNPGPSGPAEGHDGDPLSRELTPSESGEGEILHVSSLLLLARTLRETYCIFTTLSGGKNNCKMHVARYCAKIAVQCARFFVCLY